jgi:hypothetical protein
MKICEGGTYHHAIVSVPNSETHMVSKKQVINTRVGYKIHYLKALLPWASPNIEAGGDTNSNRWAHDLGVMIRQVP